MFSNGQFFRTENLTSVCEQSGGWEGGSQNGSLLSVLTPDPDLPGQFRPPTGRSVDLWKSPRSRVSRPSLLLDVGW